METNQAVMYWRIGVNVRPEWRIPLRFILCMSSVLLCIVGCRDSSATVSGKVSYQGKPLGGGTVTLIHERGGSFAAAIHPDGTYSIAKVPLGRVKVAVETKSAQTKQPPGALRLSSQVQKMTQSLPKELEGKMSGSAQEGGRFTLIPDRYANPETSGLSFVVEKGKRAYDLDLK